VLGHAFARGPFLGEQACGAQVTCARSAFDSSALQAGAHTIR
jgi:hypothetical protein